MLPSLIYNILTFNQNTYTFRFNQNKTRRDWCLWVTKMINWPQWWNQYIHFAERVIHQWRGSIICFSGFNEMLVCLPHIHSKRKKRALTFAEFQEKYLNQLHKPFFVSSSPWACPLVNLFVNVVRNVFDHFKNPIRRAQNVHQIG